MAHVHSELFQRLEERGATSPERGLQTLLTEIVEDMEALMRERGLTRAEVGRRAGLKREYISRILNNPQNVTLATLVRISNALSSELRVSLHRVDTAAGAVAPAETRDSLTASVMP